MCWRRLSSTGDTQALNLSSRRGNVKRIWKRTCEQKPLPQQQKARQRQGHHWLPTWKRSTHVNVFLHMSECRFKLSQPLSPILLSATLSLPSSREMHQHWGGGGWLVGEGQLSLQLCQHSHLSERACQSARARSMACTCASKEMGAGEVGSGRNPSGSRSSNTRQSFSPSTWGSQYCQCVFATSNATESNSHKSSNLCKLNTCHNPILSDKATYFVSQVWLFFTHQWHWFSALPSGCYPRRAYLSMERPCHRWEDVKSLGHPDKSFVNSDKSSLEKWCAIEHYLPISI